MNKYQKKFYEAMKAHPCVESVRSKYGTGRKIAIVKLKPVEVTARDSGRSICQFEATIEVGIGESGRPEVARWGDMSYQHHPHQLGGGICLNVKFTEPMEEGNYDGAIYELVNALSATDEHHASLSMWQRR